MSSTEVSSWQDQLAALNAQVTKQGSAVRQLKKDGAQADVIGEAVKALQALKISVSEIESAHASEGGSTFDRKAFDDLVLRKMFVIPSFEIHGGVKGLFDLGPPACSLKVRLTKYTVCVCCCCFSGCCTCAHHTSTLYNKRPP